MKRSMPSCAGVRYNPHNEICCSGNIMPKEGRHDACCHRNRFSPDRQVCCNDVIVPKTVAGCDIPNVCRQSPTRFVTRTQACCGGVLYPVSIAKDHECCQNVTPYKYAEQICCFGTVHARKGNASCCGTRAYDSNKQMCCAGEIKTRTPQGCPGLSNTLVHLCKKSPIPRFFPKEGYGCCAKQVGMKILQMCPCVHIRDR